MVIFTASVLIPMLLLGCFCPQSEHLQYFQACQDLNSFKHCDPFVNSPIFRLETSQVAVAPEHDAKPAGLKELEKFIYTKFKKGRTWCQREAIVELEDQVSHFERDPHLLCGPLHFLLWANV